MHSYKATDRDRVSPQQAAERLTDIAYSLIAGGPLELTVDRERLTVPLGRDLHMQRDLHADGERVELDVRLTWSAAGPDGHGGTP
jgi:hypothetical protein